MGASENFKSPDWSNPIDEDLDQMRDNFNYLLCLAAAGAEVAPGWQTAVDISTSGNYAQPDAVILTKGTRVIKVKPTWA